MKWIALLALGLAGCGPEPQPRQPDTLPTPSGPPIAQSAAPQPKAAAVADAPRWESLVRGSSTALRLVEADGSHRMEISCIGEPGRMAVSVPGFSTIGSEDRFSLGLGDEPVTLVADIARREGVSAEGPVPDNLEDLFAEAKRISALYGTQRVGPVAPPPPELVRALSKSCEKLRS